MVLSEMVLKVVVIEKVLRPSTLVSAVAEVTTFVLLSAVREELVVTVKSDSAESALGMSFEPALISGAWVVVSELLMLAQFGKGEKFVFVSKDFLVSRTQVARALCYFGSIQRHSREIVHTTSLSRAPS